MLSLPASVKKTTNRRTLKPAEKKPQFDGNNRVSDGDQAGVQTNAN